METRNHKLNKEIQTIKLSSYAKFVVLSGIAAFILLVAFSKINTTAAKIKQTVGSYLPPLDDGEEAIGVAEQQKLTSNDGSANDHYGINVSLSGDTAVVGSNGAAYVYVRNGTNWFFQQKLTASDGASGDSFGYNVAIDGNTIIVGANGKDFGSNEDLGAAYIFKRNGSNWTQQQILTANEGAGTKQFGWSVAISGGTAVVGAFLSNVNNSQQGSAYVFTQNGSNWTRQQKLTASDGRSRGLFGTNVAISENTIALGAVINTFFVQGAVYVFERNGATWTERQILKASDGLGLDYFGSSVAIDGNTIIASSTSLNDFKGAAYVFTRNGTNWTQQQKLTTPDGIYLDYFGYNLDIAGDTAVIGAIGVDIGANQDQGATYIYKRNGLTWSQQQRLTASDGAKEDRFGASVAIDSNTVLIGADYDDIDGKQDQGSAYIFSNNSSNSNPRTAFDFDGDGKADVSVFRPANGSWYLNQSTAGYSAVQFGLSTDKIVPADYDGDGKTDIAVYRNGTWYLLRSQTGFSQVQFGNAGDIPVPADFDGDGKAELAVYRNGTWFTYNLATNLTNIVQFGLASDKPVSGDYDGDGKADYAVFRPSNGTWYLLQSVNGFNAVQFGISSDKPIVGDYDNDGKTDLAVYRNGTWYIQQSSAGFTQFQFGIATDQPASADYDGDGKTDAAVYRNGIWYQQNSTQGLNIFSFGVSNDKPIPNSFVR